MHEEYDASGIFYMNSYDLNAAEREHAKDRRILFVVCFVLSWILTTWMVTTSIFRLPFFLTLLLLIPYSVIISMIATGGAEYLYRKNNPYQKPPSDDGGFLFLSQEEWRLRHFVFFHQNLNRFSGFR